MVKRFALWLRLVYCLSSKVVWIWLGEALLTRLYYVGGIIRILVAQGSAIIVDFSSL
jgi:hypothetical protein